MPPRDAAPGPRAPTAGTDGSLSGRLRRVFYKCMKSFEEEVEKEGKTFGLSDLKGLLAIHAAVPQFGIDQGRRHLLPHAGMLVVCSPKDLLQGPLAQDDLLPGVYMATGMVRMYSRMHYGGPGNEPDPNARTGDGLHEQQLAQPPAQPQPVDATNLDVVPSDLNRNEKVGLVRAWFREVCKVEWSCDDHEATKMYSLVAERKRQAPSVWTKEMGDMPYTADNVRKNWDKTLEPLREAMKQHGARQQRQPQAAQPLRLAGATTGGGETGNVAANTPAVAAADAGADGVAAPGADAADGAAAMAAADAGAGGVAAPGADGGGAHGRRQPSR
uniref:Uncharacterized protein n=1 Tax=Chlamydomonas euryale TaxID=1486919 RepID=A0A7R9YWY4_9CHLO|mmetsp:Transcript_31696/g.94474  ORF Transcript_31696/g.94474 Transcript_31696/m.94474 type:complete len:329 (+) Transcript_31696:234-1220(+)